MTKRSDSIMDSLLAADATMVEEEFGAEVHLPKKCQKCTNAVICKILPAMLGFSTYGIQISIDVCPFERSDNG